MLRADLAPGKLTVQLDDKAGRFVQILSDANTAETLRRLVMGDAPLGRLCGGTGLRRLRRRWRRLRFDSLGGSD
jgi:hypothetical protein